MLFYVDLYYKKEQPVGPESTTEYVGCYADDPADRLLGNEIKRHDNMTPAVCRDYCEDFGSSYYATQVSFRQHVLYTDSFTRFCLDIGSLFALPFLPPPVVALRKLLRY